MKSLLASILFVVVPIQVAVGASKLPTSEGQAIKAEVLQIMSLFNKGETQALLDLTHESIYMLSGTRRRLIERPDRESSRS